MVKLKLLYVIMKLEFSQVLENPFQSSVKRAKYSSDTSHTVPLCAELGMDFSEPVKRLILPFIALISLVILITVSCKGSCCFAYYFVVHIILFY